MTPPTTSLRRGCRILQAAARRGSLGGTAGVAFNSAGNIFVIHRGPMPLMEFGSGLQLSYPRLRRRAVRPAARRRRPWTTSGRPTLPRTWSKEFNPSGRLEMVLGVKGHTGEWHPFGHLRPAPRTERGEWSVHRATSSCCKATARASRGCCSSIPTAPSSKAGVARGNGPGEFDLPHSLVFDAQGLLYIAYRNNARIQVFDTDGGYVRESQHPGAPCGCSWAPTSTSGWRTATPARS